MILCDYSQQYTTHLILLLLVLKPLEDVEYILFKEFSLVRFDHILPAIFIALYSILDITFTVCANAASSLKLKQELLIVVIEDLLVNILPLNTLDQSHNVQIVC